MKKDEDKLSEKEFEDFITAFHRFMKPYMKKNLNYFEAAFTVLTTDAFLCDVKPEELIKLIAHSYQAFELQNQEAAAVWKDTRIDCKSHIRE